jgi:hypothetical protein
MTTNYKAFNDSKNAISFYFLRFNPMRRALCIILLPCFLISVLFLPEGDFSLLTQLPALYQHCKATEDPDMDFIDFITDHLINIDGIFDKHLAGDDQKPHQPFQFRFLQHNISYVAGNLFFISTPSSVFKKSKCTKGKSFYSKYIVYIFHPPDSHLYCPAA